jgi:hypothetical protein
VTKPITIKQHLMSVWEDDASGLQRIFDKFDKNYEFVAGWLTAHTYNESNKFYQTVENNHVTDAVIKAVEKECREFVKLLK